MIIFENSGEIDPRCIMVMGVNVKDTANPIGYFGTGLKYAIAICVRLGLDIKIQSGLREFTFRKAPGTIRGKEFDFLEMIENGVALPLAYTTEYGKGWDLWMAYRELYCNAVDESGTTAETTIQPAPTAGITRVIVMGEAFSKEHGRRATWLLSGTPDVFSVPLHLHKASNKGVFYRGILVAGLPKPSRYTYNIQEKVQLSEDRTLISYMAESRVVNFITTHCFDQPTLRDVLSAKSEFWEQEINYAYANGPPSEAFVTAMESLIEDNVAFINISAYQYYGKYKPPKNIPESAMTDVEAQMMRKAQFFLRGLGYEITFPVIVVDSLGGSTVFGLAKDDKIYIARECFRTGTKFLAGTLLEEQIHLSKGYSDESREMQNYLLNEMMSLGERIQGAPI